MDEILQIIAKIRDYDPLMAEALTDLADNYKHDQILSIIENSRRLNGRPTG